jgi:hypothetical protein
VTAIFVLALEASRGYFEFPATFDRCEVIQEDNRRPPDLKEAVRLYLEGHG